MISHRKDSLILTGARMTSKEDAGSLTVGGRLLLTVKLHHLEGLSLSVGSSMTRLADVNCDVNAQARPDVVASVLYLRFRKKSFSSVLFTDVIEHLPSRTEERALQEIRGCLFEGGQLVLTTPNDVALFKMCDVKYWVSGHRHYKPEFIHQLLIKTDFSIRNEFASGWICQMVEQFLDMLYFFVRLPLKKITRMMTPSPLLLETSLNEEYKVRRKNGYTLFFIAQRN